MGDAQRRKFSASKAGGKSTIGDGKEVGETAIGRTSQAKAKLPAKRRVAGDSLSIGVLPASTAKESACKLTSEFKEEIKEVPSLKSYPLEEMVVNASDMDPTDPSKEDPTNPVQGGGSVSNLEPGDEESLVSATEKNANVFPRKVLSLDKNVGPVNCSPKKTFSLLSSYLPSLSNHGGTMEPRPTDSEQVDKEEATLQGGASVNQQIVDEFLKDIYPRKAFSLEKNLGEHFESLRKTSSLITKLHPREESLRKDSPENQPPSQIELNKPSNLSGKSSETNIMAAKTSKVETSNLSRMFPNDDSGIEPRVTMSLQMDGNVASEVKRRRGFAFGEEKSRGDKSGIFSDDGGALPVEEDDVKPGVSTLKSSIAETDGRLDEPFQLEQSCSAKDLLSHQQQQQQCQQHAGGGGGGGGGGQSLQSTCDVSSWSLCHYHSLPQWMQDNEFILSCHRPPLPSFFACFKSIFRLHTETLNIWTHLLGCVAFVAMGAYFLALPREAVWLQEKLAFGAFFGGGAACFALSSAYHTLWCHSPAVGRLFSKLDYCGIALLIMGSFVPWLYYAFYCRWRLLAAYLALVVALGALSVLVSLWGRFGEPRFRPLRAGVFVAYGLSGVVPALHFAVAEGWRRAVAQASLHWLGLMGALYVSGACIYALRVPERFFPGRCDLLFQSHQIFHVFVIIAALVHYHGLTEMAVYRLSFTDCASRALA